MKRESSDSIGNVMGLSYSLYSNILTRFCASRRFVSKHSKCSYSTVTRKEGKQKWKLKFKWKHFHLTYYLKWTIIHTKIYSNKGLIILS